MKNETKKALEAAGWRFGDASDFLEAINSHSKKIMKHEKLVDEIANLVNRRQSESFHINTETARFLINDSIEKYIHDLIHDISLEEINGERIFHNLIDYYRLPDTHKYLFSKDYDDMDETERPIHYKALPPAKLTNLE
jgi:hypothetical protein